jgi:hypothetical protein
MDTWATLRTIPPECWQAETPPGGGPIWRLSPDWTANYFPGVYHQLLRDGDPFAEGDSTFVFERPDGAFEVYLHSRLAPGEHYVFIWRDGDAQKEIARARAGAVTGKAVASGAGPAVVRVVSADVDEEVQLHLKTLALVVAESRGAQAQKLAPWKRMLSWFGRLQTLDPHAFGRVPPPLQKFLRQPGFEPAAESLGAEDLERSFKLGVLPRELSWIFPQDVQPMLESLRALQALANDPQRAMNPMYALDIPHLVRVVDAGRLDWIDVQVFMTIGALREAYGFIDREMMKLVEHRPDLQAARQSPQGRSVFEQDPAVQAILNHPLGMAHKEDIAEMQQHRQGNHGPSPRQMLRAQEQQTRQLAMMAGAPFFPNPYLAEPPPPPWKIYRPYWY